MGRAPLHESYGARGGDTLEESGMPHRIAAGKGKIAKPKA
jgi:hypothetical protein